MHTIWERIALIRNQINWFISLCDQFSQAKFTSANASSLCARLERLALFRLSYNKHLLHEKSCNTAVLFCNNPFLYIPSEDIALLPIRLRSESKAKGLAFLRSGNRTQAQECFQKCVDITPEMALEVIKVSSYTITVHHPVMVTSMFDYFTDVIACQFWLASQNYNPGQKSWDVHCNVFSENLHCSILPSTPHNVQNQSAKSPYFLHATFNWGEMGAGECTVFKLSKNSEHRVIVNA